MDDEEFIEDCRYIELWGNYLRELGERYLLGEDITARVQFFWDEAINGIPPADIILHTVDGGRVRISFSIEIDNEAPPEF